MSDQSSQAPNPNSITVPTYIVIDSTIVTAIVAQIQSNFANKTLSTTNILTYTSELMQLVETYPSLSGSEKQAIVIQALQNLANTSTLDDSSKATLDSLITQVVPIFINLIISATNGELELNKKLAACKCW
jgi:hypothetical protein